MLTKENTELAEGRPVPSWFHKLLTANDMTTAKNILIQTLLSKKKMILHSC